jgi:hypothetical protein
MIVYMNCTEDQIRAEALRDAAEAFERYLSGGPVAGESWRQFVARRLREMADEEIES